MTAQEPLPTAEKDARLAEWRSTCVMCRVEEGRREPAVAELTHPREGGGYPACEMHAARLGWERGPLASILPPVARTPIFCDAGELWEAHDGGACCSGCNYGLPTRVLPPGSGRTEDGA